MGVRRIGHGCLLLLTIAAAQIASFHAAETLPAEVTLPIERYVADLEALAGTAGEALETTDVQERKQIAENLAGSIPAQGWIVTSAEEPIRVSRTAIDAALAAIASAPENNDRWHYLIRMLETMASEARVAIDVPQQSDPTAAERLDEILSRSEFAELREPGAIDRLREKIVAWVDDLLDRLFGDAGVSKVSLEVVAWAIVLVVFVTALTWILRAAGARRAPLSLGPVVPSGPAPHDWRSLAAEAGAAARAGRYRDAVRCAFWACILKLAEQGVWDLQNDRTPREYLRALPAGHPLEQQLTDLARRYEGTWYGRRPATEEEFRQVLTHLQGAGVRIAWPGPTNAS